MLEAIIALVVATTFLLGSPGPVPLALAAVGAVFGFRAGVPFLIGILVGLAVAISLGSAGLAVLFETVPSSRIVVQTIGALYICYIAFKIATAPILTANDAKNESIPRFRDGLILNLLNPKAYAAFLALFSQFLLPFSSSFMKTTATAVVAFVVAIIVDTIWLALGSAFRPVFESPKLARPVRVTFGVLMVIAVAAVFLTGFHRPDLS